MTFVFLEKPECKPCKEKRGKAETKGWHDSRDNVQARAHEEKGSPVLKEVKALVRRDWPEISYLCPSQSIEGETFAACKKLKPTFSPFAHGSAGIRRAKLVF